MQCHRGREQSNYQQQRLRVEYTHSDNILDIEEEMTFCAGRKAYINAYTLQRDQIVICVRSSRSMTQRHYPMQ